MLARMCGKRSPDSLRVKENGRKDIMGTNVEAYPKIKNRTIIEPSYITSRCIPKGLCVLSQTDLHIRVY